MAEGQTAARAAVETNESTKEALQRQMSEARESITQTVTDIKDTVVDGVQSVKESVTETLDWREQFRSHPVAWSIGALSVGFVIGKSLSAALEGSKDDALLSHLSALGDHFTDELSKQGMGLLAPVLTGTVLVPILTSKLKELTGLDFSDLAQSLIAQHNTAAGKGEGKKKRAAPKKQGKKKKTKGKRA